MKKGTLLFLFIWLVLLMACSNGGDVATAVQYINALEEGDVETATELVCPERNDTIMKV